MPSFAIVAGARPNFMKIAPLLRALEGCEGCATTLIHTGQHYDRNLSDVFFEELGIRRPDAHLDVGGGSHAEQTARVIERIAPFLEQGMNSNNMSDPLDALIVVGDVNSTMAASIAAAKLNLPVVHVEAGLRSNDRTMPEEINRIITDSISDLLLVSEPTGVANLLQEGHSEHDIHLVGNLMIDTLFAQLDNARKSSFLADLGLRPGQYAALTLHRPSNVDDANVLTAIVDVLVELGTRMPLVFPVHPRTRARLEAFGLLGELESAKQIHLLGPMGYQDFLSVTSQAKLVITDSGGLQEETTALAVPCLTMRENTERPATVEFGSSTLVGNCAKRLNEGIAQVLAGTYKSSACPELWDGNAASRIVDVLTERYGS